MVCKLAILMLTLCLLLLSCSRGEGDRGYEIFPDMVHSVAYEAYSENEITKDGKTMMVPPEGSIARGHMPFTYGQGEKEAERAGRELKDPYEVSQKTLVRGQFLYETYCLVCHGVKGEGDGPLIPKFPNPPSFTAKRVRAFNEGRLFHIIAMGAGDMPSHGVQISWEDRWYLIHYVQKLQNQDKEKGD